MKTFFTPQCRRKVHKSGLAEEGNPSYYFESFDGSGYSSKLEQLLQERGGIQKPQFSPRSQANSDEVSTDSNSLSKTPDISLNALPRKLVP